MNTVVELIAKVQDNQGGNLVGVKGYMNQYGEVSDQRFNIGVNYTKAMQYDLKRLKGFDTQTLFADQPFKGSRELFDYQTLDKARAEMITALEKRLSPQETPQSQAQKDAYISLGNGLRLKDNTLYIWGFRMDKQIHIQGDYPTVNSAPKTLAKKAIEKHLDLKVRKFINLKLGGLETIKLKGIEITL